MSVTETHAVLSLFADMIFPFKSFDCVAIVKPTRIETDYLYGWLKNCG